MCLNDAYVARVDCACDFSWLLVQRLLTALPESTHHYVDMHWACDHSG